MGEVFWTALRLGLTSFGGPIAHLGYFERTYVRKLHWLNNGEYAGLVALCQTLPGPTSSQVGFLIGLRRAGTGGAIAAWVGFTLPSAILMYAFAIFAPPGNSVLARSILHGLMLTAVAVVAQAVWNMARTLCPDRQRVAIALLSATILLFAPDASMQLAVLLLGAVGGWLMCRDAELPQIASLGNARPRTAVTASLSYVLLLAALPGLALLTPHGPIALAAVFYRAGALVFGGGHVVLPLLQQGLVPDGWISNDDFLSGYGFAQGMPGPLFTVSAYLAVAGAPPHLSALWATIAVVAIFLPGLLLALGGQALWSALTRFRGAAAALAGINAAVVGILAKALYDPVWRGGIRDVTDAAVAVAGLVLLIRWRVPPLAVVVLCVGAGLCRGLLFL